jgi:hypothetical protein
MLSAIVPVPPVLPVLPVLLFVVALPRQSLDSDQPVILFNLRLIHWSLRRTLPGLSFGRSRSRLFLLTWPVAGHVILSSK